ncbi:hypothetical protein ABT116_23590 [Streptomyces sp. NPDC002130]|uniref:hypothetical protein n=1 Tax=Streptomyces sp. NPDC002130 TaxID=3155568 RepID=UPI0033328D19
MSCTIRSSHLAGEYCNSRTPILHQCSHTTAEGVVGGVTGVLTGPHTLLLARYDEAGDLRLIARTTRLTAEARRDLGARLHPVGPDHP